MTALLAKAAGVALASHPLLYAGEGGAGDGLQVHSWLSYRVESKETRGDCRTLQGGELSREGGHVRSHCLQPAPENADASGAVRRSEASCRARDPGTRESCTCEPGTRKCQSKCSGECSRAMA
jgi:hypothetical protein